MQAGVEEKAVVLAINGGNKQRTIYVYQNGAPEAKRHRTGPSLRQPVLNWNAKDNIKEVKNYKMEAKIFSKLNNMANDAEKVPIIKMARGNGYNCKNTYSSFTDKINTDRAGNSYPHNDTIQQITIRYIPKNQQTKSMIWLWRPL